MISRLKRTAWALLAVLGAVAVGTIASTRGEPVNSLWLVAAAASIYLIGFRFYAKFIAARVMALNDQRATPAERFRDGHDFEPTNKWILFGHHFAAIAGPGPLVGPTLAAQFGYLPGTLWILFGAVVGRCGPGLRHPVLHRMRRDGKTLGPDGARRDRQSGRLRFAGNGAADHDHPAGGGRAGGGECVKRQSLGHVHHSDDDADCGLSWACICASCVPARCWSARRLGFMLVLAKYSSADRQWPTRNAGRPFSRFEAWPSQ